MIVLLNSKAYVVVARTKSSINKKGDICSYHGTLTAAKEEAKLLAKQSKDCFYWAMLRIEY